LYRLSGNIQTLEDIRRLEAENESLKAAIIETEKKTEHKMRMAERIFKQNLRLRKSSQRYKDIKRLQHS